MVLFRSSATAFVSLFVCFCCCFCCCFLREHTAKYRPPKPSWESVSEMFGHYILTRVSVSFVPFVTHFLVSSQHTSFAFAQHTIPYLCFGTHTCKLTLCRLAELAADFGALILLMFVVAICVGCCCCCRTLTLSGLRRLRDRFR